MLLSSLKSMQAGLADIVTQVRSGVEEIHLGTREISAGNTDLSSRTEEQAAAAAGALEEQGRDLTHAVSVFKVSLQLA